MGWDPPLAAQSIPILVSGGQRGSHCGGGNNTWKQSLQLFFFCITNKEDPMSLLVWVGYWPSVPEYAPGQRSAVEYSISMYQRRPAAAHQPVPATSLHSPAVVCGYQWSEAHTIHSPAPRCAPNITYSRSIAQCVVKRCYLIASVRNIPTCFRYSISTKWFWV